MKRKNCTRLYQYLATFTGLLAMITSGMHYAWPSPSLPQLLDTNSTSTSFKITSDEGSWIAIMPLCGSIISSMFSAVTTDILGRKRSMLVTALPFFVAWLMVAYASSAIVLCIGKFLAGLADGIAFTVMPLYVGEIADPEIRGFLGASISAVWILGMLLINIIGSYLSIKMTAIISSVVPLLLLVTFIWMPESPYWLIMKKDFDRARESLKKFKGNDYKVEDELDRLKLAVKTQMENSGKFLDVFTKKKNRKGLLIMMILRNTQQLSGAAALTFYTQSIFLEAGDDFISPVTATIILISFQCVMAGVCSILVDKTGRKILLLVSVVGSSLTLFALGIYFYIKSFTHLDVSSFSFIPLTALVGYVIMFNVGSQPIPLLMLGELFPTNVKAFASALSELYFSIIASVVSKLFQIMNDNFGMYLSFIIFGSCCVVNVVFIVCFVPETKGENLESVQENLGKKKQAVT